jgi:glycosyltransferase involved in cell wall biosynthesis
MIHDSPTALSRGITVVIPVYNSANILPVLVPQIETVLATLGRASEIILINDGSRDGSWNVISDLCRSNADVRGINLMRNFGQHNALLCGVRAARYDVVVTMDDDLQHPPASLPQLVAALDDYDVVYGTPAREQHGLWRDLASRATKRALQGALGAEVAAKVSAFRAFRTQIREAFRLFDAPFVSIDVLLTWGTTRFTCITVPHAPRHEGTSNYTFRKLLTHTANMMTGFSTLPLQFASIMGFVLTLFGLGIFALVIARYLISGSVVPGFPFLASIISLFAGGQLLALGIMGEYLARMHFRLMAKPAYVERARSEEVSAKTQTLDSSSAEPAVNEHSSVPAVGSATASAKAER